MLWSIRKRGLLQEVKNAVYSPTLNRSVKHRVVIEIIRMCIQYNRELFVEKCGDSHVNPIQDTHIIIHVLDNFYIMDMFPAHKKVIKKILM